MRIARDRLGQCLIDRFVETDERSSAQLRIVQKETEPVPNDARTQRPIFRDHVAQRQSETQPLFGVRTRGGVHTGRIARHVSDGLRITLGLGLRLPHIRDDLLDETHC